MHDAAYQWVAEKVSQFGPFTGTIVEFGSHDINGSVRPLFANAERYIGIDPQPGPGVDHVADAAAWAEANRLGLPNGLQIEATCVVCTEVFEHTADWRSLIRAAAQLLMPGGVFICTAAGPGRPKHSIYPDGHGKDGIRPGEWYENIQPFQLHHELTRWFCDVETNTKADDVRGCAIKD